ncbi:hypothetical protein L3556_08915 [Candidatus Synechococcus calcipolaris G9]|uniref:Secreted protein n=1 Tax=Candidatus Synechococcus calcipolaris G9 TaxID=1497997 RepID=A0ABT6EZL9_9SYNE|nr:hypothetical protein [Candidatus Synechococcus calcipolaris]MDG2991044.1 hypothetical protein [Candidatus Synechococcus calcipolaris G9]
MKYFLAVMLVLATVPLPALGQGRPLRCQNTESTFVETETKNYWVNICGGDFPAYYVAMNKGDRNQSIRLRLSDYDPQGNYFEAVNQSYIYILSKTPRGMFLTVSQGTKELLREPVLQPW